MSAAHADWDDQHRGAPERIATDEIAFSLAGILDTGVTAEQVFAVLEIIDGIRQAARQDERERMLETHVDKAFALDCRTAARKDERRKMVAGLASIYSEHYVAVGKLCDEELDRSGRLLGEVRDEVIRRRALAEEVT